MNTLSSTFAASATLDLSVGETGGLYAFPFFYLGFVYFYFSSSAGDT